MTKRFLIPALLLACAAGTAQAASVTYTAYTTPQNTPLALPFDQTLSLSKFNPSLGTLTGISFTVSNSVSGYVSIYNVDTSSHTFTNATAGDTVTASTTVGSVPESVMTTSNVTVASGSASPGVNNYLPATTVTTTGSQVLPMSDWGAYTGTGGSMVSFSFAAGAATYGGTETNGSGDLYFGGKVKGYGSISITYTYTPFAVPEPASLGLLGIGMAGLLSFRRLFKRKVVA
jgi:hypothetical protein